MRGRRRQAVKEINRIGSGVMEKRRDSIKSVDSEKKDSCDVQKFKQRGEHREGNRF